MTDAIAVDDRSLYDAWFSIFHLPAVTAGLDLGIFSALEHEPATTEQLSARLQASAGGLRSLVHVLCSLGFLSETAGIVRLTPVSTRYLLPTSPSYWGDHLMTVVEQKLHDKISNVVRYGGGRVYADSWGNGSISTDVAEAFTSQMHTQLLAPAQSAVEAGIFSGLRRVLDVGGGSGALCIALTRSQQGTSSTLMDLPAVCEVAKRFVDEAGVRGIDYWPANFFEDRWPDGFDGVWFSNIFHNFSGEQCFELASKARQALVPGGKLFLHEMLLDKSAPSFVPGVFDLLMFMNHSARQFHEEDFRRLLDEARFENVRRVHTFGYYSTIEATRAL